MPAKGFSLESQLNALVKLLDDAAADDFEFEILLQRCAAGLQNAHIEQQRLNSEQLFAGVVERRAEVLGISVDELKDKVAEATGLHASKLSNSTIISALIAHPEAPKEAAAEMVAPTK